MPLEFTDRQDMPPSDGRSCEMIDGLLFTVTLVAALGCGLIAGAFFAFSSFVMKALDRLPPTQGIAAMQSINVVVINPLFLGVFVGTALACVLAAVLALVSGTPDRVLILVGGALYVVGTLLVTGFFNVPLNNDLAAVDPVGSDAAGRWARYVRTWTGWNHVRTVAALGASAVLVLTLA